MWALIDDATGLFINVSRHKNDDAQVEVASDDPRIEYMRDPEAFALQTWDNVAQQFVYDFEAVRAAELALVDAEATAFMDQLTQGYPAAEMVSWSKQESEANALKADPAGALTPFLDTLASLRGMTRYEIASRVRRNVNAFEMGAANIIGARQKARDLIEAMVEGVDTVTDIQNVHVVLPETFWTDVATLFGQPHTADEFRVDPPTP